MATSVEHTTATQLKMGVVEAGSLTSGLKQGEEAGNNGQQPSESFAIPAPPLANAGTGAPTTAPDESSAEIDNEKPAAGEGKENDETPPKIFPQILMEILSQDEHTDIISWLPHGHSFMIYKKKKFAAQILPKFFKATKFTSFTRKLNRWGFTRVSRGPEMGSYYHNMFKREHPYLCLRMTSHSGSKAKTAVIAAPTATPTFPFPFAAATTFATPFGFAAQQQQQQQFPSMDFSAQKQALLHQQIQHLQWQQMQLQQLQRQQQVQTAELLHNMGGKPGGGDQNPQGNVSAPAPGAVGANALSAVTQNQGSYGASSGNLLQNQGSLAAAQNQAALLAQQNQLAANCLQTGTPNDPAVSSGASQTDAANNISQLDTQQAPVAAKNEELPLPMNREEV